MGRTLKSAKESGARFERSVADYLHVALGDDAVDRQVRTGAKDTGDIRGVYLHGKRVVVECKEYGGRHSLPEWLREAEIERGNADAEYGVVVWKRKGTTDPREQHVSMTLETFAQMLAGGRDKVEEE